MHFAARAQNRTEGEEMSIGVSLTPDEDEKLRLLARDGKSAAEIGAELGREAHSVRKRAKRLSIALAKNPRGFG